MYLNIDISLHRARERERERQIMYGLSENNGACVRTQAGVEVS